MRNEKNIREITVTNITWTYIALIDGLILFRQIDYCSNTRIITTNGKTGYDFIRCNSHSTVCNKPVTVYAVRFPLFICCSLSSIPLWVQHFLQHVNCTAPNLMREQRFIIHGASNLYVYVIITHLYVIATLKTPTIMPLLYTFEHWLLPFHPDIFLELKL